MLKLDGRRGRAIIEGRSSASPISRARLLDAFNKLQALAGRTAFADYAAAKDWVWGTGPLRSARAAAVHIALDADCARRAGRRTGKP